MKTVSLIALFVFGIISEMTAALKVGTKVTPIENHNEDDGTDNTLVSLISEAFKKTDPKHIEEVANGTKGTELNFPMSNGAFRKGFYTNTTRQAIDQFYTYMWKW